MFPTVEGIVAFDHIGTFVPQLSIGTHLSKSLLPACPTNLNQGRPELIMSLVSQLVLPLMGRISLPE